MPELPEVEVVKKSLEHKLKNLTIKRVFINNNKLRYRIDNKSFHKLKDFKIISVKRRAKYLLINLNNNLTILAHLGMTGKFFVVSKKNIKSKTSYYYNINEEKDKKHNHLIFIFKNGSKLIYNDVRKFGFIKLDLIKKFKENNHLKNLGPEPLEKYFNFKYVKSYLTGRKRIIKDLLMDQKFVSGLGNIYVNEILFYSKVKPTRKISKLKNFEIEKILIGTKKILRKAISFGGSSIKDFSSSNGKTGSFQQHFNVYGKKGVNCSNTDCNFKIKKIVLSYRASFFCPKCQK